MADKENVFHNVVAYDGKQEAKDASKNRLVTITFKTPKDAPADYVKPQNRCVEVPLLGIKCSPEILQDAMTCCLQDLQDEVIRKLIVTGDEPGSKKKLTVSDDEIGYEAIAEYAKLAAVSGKLSAEAVEGWFLANISDKLTVALADALKFPDKCTPEQSAKLDHAVQQHKKLFGSMVGHKFNPDRKTALSLLKAVNLAEDDKIRRILSKKLETIITPPTQELLGL